MCRPVHGLIFLFKYSGKVEADPCVDYTVPDLFFAHQVCRAGMAAELRPDDCALCVDGVPLAWS